MPRFKSCDTSLKFIPVDFAAQIVAGSFEHALCYLIDKEFNLGPLIARFKNDEMGAPAYPPAVCSKSFCWPTAVAS